MVLRDGGLVFVFLLFAVFVTALYISEKEKDVVPVPPVVSTGLGPVQYICENDAEHCECYKAGHIVTCTPSENESGDWFLSDSKAK